MRENEEAAVKSGAVAMANVTQLLDEVVATLESKAAEQERAGRGDAIDAALNRAPRITKAVSLRDAPEVRAFREAMIDGLIRVDTANQLLRLVNEVISRLVR
jgi:hypothetical protein